MTDQQLKLAAGQGQSSFSGKKFFRRALDYWYLYVISLLACISYAWFSLHYATPMYKVYGQILVQDDKNGGTSQALSGNGVDLSSLFSGKTNMANEIAIFQTTDLCKKVVKSLKLYTFYYHKGSVRTVELYKGAPFKVNYQPDNDTVTPITMELKFPTIYSTQFKIKTGGKTLSWHFNDTLHYNNARYCFINSGVGFDTTASYLFQVQSPDAVAASIAGNLGADLLSVKSTIVNLVYNTNLPQKGVDVLSGIMNAYVNRNLEQKNISSDSTLQFIDSRIALVGRDLGDIESTIQHFKQNNKIADLTVQSAQLITNSNTASQHLSDLDVQLQVIKMMMAYLQNEQNNRRPIPALLNSDPTFSELTTSYNALQVQRDKLLLSLKADNPLAANLDVQIAGLRSDMIRSLQSQTEALTASKQQITGQNNEFNEMIHDVPAKERQFLDLSRQQDIKQALYLFLLQRREEVAIARASNSSNAYIIAAPKPSYLPYQPVASTAITIAILLGFVLPTVFVGLKFLLNNKVLSREDVTDATPATILSEIGHSSKQGLLDLKEEGRSILAEQFRIFRTNMDFALANISSPVIMITSCLSGEGKSFIAANLGLIYAVSGKRVLIVELDLRRPKLSKMLNIDNDTGFSNYIISDKPVTDYIQSVTSVSSSLFLLPSGPIPPNPAELLLSEKTSIMMTELKKHFDIIIVDTAPVGAVTDAQIVSKSVDLSLYIVRQGYSIKSSIEIVNDMIINAKLPSLYLILNDIKEGASYKYGYGYRYGYGYGYSDNVKKRKWWQLKK